jgi:uncharacterized membrane protein (DUF485 family)
MKKFSCHFREVLQASPRHSSSHPTNCQTCEQGWSTFMTFVDLQWGHVEVKQSKVNCISLLNNSTKTTQKKRKKKFIFCGFASYVQTTLLISFYQTFLKISLTSNVSKVNSFISITIVIALCLFKMCQRFYDHLYACYKCVIRLIILCFPRPGWNMIHLK